MTGYNHSRPIEINVNVYFDMYDTEIMLTETILYYLSR